MRRTLAICMLAASIAGVFSFPSLAAAWGFKAELWSYTIADPWGAWRQYYYNRCNPKPGVPGREFRMYGPYWIYRMYECWAVLA